MRLFIAPKRDVALSISVALGGPSKPTGASFKFEDDEVTWLSGHLLRLGNPQEYDERYETWALDDLPMSWPISYLPDSRHEDQLSAVIELAKQADELVNAGDPDPEGQRLIDEVIEYAGLESKPMTRLLINDNNPMAILKASLSMRNNKDYRGLSLSALSRSVCDQRYGFNLTRTYTLLARQQGYIGVLSVGRVQTPILGLIVAKDKARESHQPTSYYEVWANIEIRNQSIPFQYIHRNHHSEDELLADRQVDFMSDNLPINSISEYSFAEHLCTETTGKPASIASISTDEKRKPAPLPHSLLSLQADAAGQFGYKPSHTHAVAQRLRDEYMAITYHRSDSRYLSNERFREAPALLDALAGSFPTQIQFCDKQHRSKAFNSEKVSAHHAIIPTLNIPSLDIFDEDEKNIYTLIVNAYVAQFYKDELTTVTTLIIDINEHHFKATASVQKEQGWRSLLGNDYEIDSNDSTQDINNTDQVIDSRNLEAITRFDHGKVLAVNTITKETVPPNSYAMKTLLQDLTKVAKYVTNPAIKKLLLEKDSAKENESGGIGTPATRDKHIETLFSRGFIVEEGHQITSTSIGRDFHDALPDFAVKPDMTALWHQKQKQIEYGLIDYQTFISEVDTIIADEVDRAKRLGLRIKVKPTSCPVCSEGHLVLRISKANKQFWGCSSFPTCRTTYTDVKGKPDVK